jgi:hypothetical protein
MTNQSILQATRSRTRATAESGERSNRRDACACCGTRVPRGLQRASRPARVRRREGQEPGPGRTSRRREVRAGRADLHDDDGQQQPPDRLPGRRAASSVPTAVAGTTPGRGDEHGGCRPAGPGLMGEVIQHDGGHAEPERDHAEHDGRHRRRPRPQARAHQDARHSSGRPRCPHLRRAAFRDRYGPAASRPFPACRFASRVTADRTVVPSHGNHLEARSHEH